MAPLRIGVVDATTVSKTRKRKETRWEAGDRSMTVLLQYANYPARSYISVMPLAVHGVR